MERREQTKFNTSTTAPTGERREEAVGYEGSPRKHGIKEKVMHGLEKLTGKKERSPSPRRQGDVVVTKKLPEQHIEKGAHHTQPVLPVEHHEHVISHPPIQEKERIIHEHAGAAPLRPGAAAEQQTLPTQHVEGRRVHEQPIQPVREHEHEVLHKPTEVHHTQVHKHRSTSPVGEQGSYFGGEREKELHRKS